MAFSLKTWVDRISEFPNRRKLDTTDITDTYDVVRSEGIVSVEGDKFNATEMNDLENRTKTAIDAVETIADAASSGLSTHVADTTAHMTTTQKTALAAAVPNTRKVNNKVLSADINLTATDIGLGNLNNTADANKSVNYASSSGYANSAGSAPANGGTSAACSGNSATAGTANYAHYSSHAVGSSGAALRNITMSTVAPSGGQDGDVWHQYK